MRRLFLALTMLAWAACAWGAEGTPAPTVPSTIKGRVLEVLDVESFSYLRLKTADGEIWAAISKAPVKVGSEVTIQNITMMKDFDSKSLKKHFDLIAFGALAGPPGAAAGAASSGATAPGAAASGAASAGGAAGGHGAGGTDMAAMHAGFAKGPADAGEIKVAKAPGPDARTVAEIVGGKAQLKDKSVVVRGKVVKFTPEVLGKNWIHLRDGTGSQDKGTNDILVTTKDEAKIGDVVLVKGVVRTDRDFGSGYSYAVLIEEATLQR